MKVLLMLLFPTLALAQNPLAGKSFRTKTSESCKETITGGCIVYSYMTMAFDKDSVTFIYTIRRTDEEQPDITRNTYAYKMSIAGDSIYLNTPNGDRYIIRESCLVSDCAYNRGTAYFEIISE
jgi:hypothetical protein